MENSIYTTLARQTGLLREMQTVANNIANLSTTGFRKEGVVFAEYISALEGPAGSLSQASAAAHVTIAAQGALRQTGGAFDLAVEGPGFFMIATPAGDRLTRAGAFTLGPEELLASLDGYQVLDAGGAPIFVPQDLGAVAVAADGTISAGGVPIGQVGLFQPADPLDLQREDGVRFAVEGAIEPAPEARVLHGFVEGSNVNPVTEIARMIEVQRAYELGQAFLEREDKRIGSVISTLGKT